MLKQLIVFGFLAIALVACNDTASTAEEAGHEHHDHDHEGHDHDHEGGTADMEGDGVHFGETIDAQGAISFEEMLTQVSNSEVDSVAVKVVGTVGAVCQAKGCWMDLGPSTASENGMRVRFKDYGFFVPKDIAGRQAVIEGYAFREVTSVEELRHYAEDEGLSKEEIEKINEPLEEVKFLASGVYLMEEPMQKEGE